MTDKAKALIADRIALFRMTLAREEKRPDRDRERQLALDLAELCDLAEKQARVVEVAREHPCWGDGCTLCAALAALDEGE